MIRTLFHFAQAGIVAGIASCLAMSAGALELVETPMLESAVIDGTLPPVAERIPDNPAIVDMSAIGKVPGRSGGEITWLARRSRDIRIMTVYGYSRLVGFSPDFEVMPDILEDIEVDSGRIFTLHLRPGHRWSDGAPFTTEDFRYTWYDIYLNDDLKPYGPDARLLVNGELPTVQILDQTTIRYSWSAPNPEFLPALAGARPLYIYSPAQYLRQFHAGYAAPDELARKVEDAGARNWAALHTRRGNLYETSNINLPVLQPWVNTTAPPSDRFVFERNPYYHRVDADGIQLPYLDRVIVNIADSALIPAKTGAGESDLQARSLRFDNITFLKEGETRNDYSVRLWPTALGSEIALYPNLNAEDDVWRTLNRDVRFRRALSMAIDRDEINAVIYFGLATPGNNTALAASPFFNEDRLSRWATFDIEQANALLDEIGLTDRGSDGIRLLPDGRPLEIVVETAGERTVEVDVLELIRDTWKQVGVSLFTNTSQRDVFRTRVFSGDITMSIWFGMDNALFGPDSVPTELVPVDQNWLQYPKWGQYVQTGGEAGEPPDMDFGVRLIELYDAWRNSVDRYEKSAIIEEMLDIQADQVTSIGVVQGVLQPIVVSNRLQNVPGEGIFSWDPGAHFGMYRPDTFWRAD